MNPPQNSPLVWLALYCLLVLVASLAGGSLPTLLRLTHTRLQLAISLVAGLMFGLAMLEMLPHAAAELGSLHTGAAWLIAGFLVMFFLQRFLPFHQHDVDEGQPAAACGHVHSHAHDSARPLGWVGVAVGLSLHSVFDGLALAASVAVADHGHGGSLGLGTALAIILHKPFCAMSITTLMSASHAPRRWHHFVNVAFSLVTPAGALLFFLGAGHLVEAHPAWLGVALAFCAGTFLCIACADLLPELQFHAHDRVKLSFALLLGLAIAVLIGKFGHPAHEGPEQEHGVPPSTAPVAPGQHPGLPASRAGSVWDNATAALEV